MGSVVGGQSSIESPAEIVVQDLNSVVMWVPEQRTVWGARDVCLADFRLSSRLVLIRLLPSMDMLSDQRGYTNPPCLT